MRPPAANAPLFIVLNARSGACDAVAVRTEIEAALSEGGRRFEVLPTERARSVGEAAADAVRRARQSDGVVVAAGGDGTLNAVAQALRGCDLALGIIPLGTFNYFARAHGVPQEPGAAARALLGAQPISAQVGLVNDRCFLVNASIGLYPQLLEDREAFKKVHGRSRAMALLSGMATLLRERRQWRLRIESEQGRRELRTPTLFVGNNALQLERIGIPEAALVAQGKGVLAAVVVRAISTASMVGLALRGALGRLGDSEQVDTFGFRELLADPLGYRRIKVACDGEVLRMTPPLHFRAGPPLMLLAPAAEDSAALA
jgi:diacylglycerol kinase family enzyme